LPVAAIFWTAFALGVVFCAPPGAVMTEALRRGVRRGFAGALLTELGSLVGDATWAALALSGVAYLAVYRPVATGLTALGVLLLFYLAWHALRDAWAGALPTARQPTSGGDFAAGAALSLSNPQNIALWLGVGGGAVAALGAVHRRDLLVVFFIAFMLACIAWCFFMAGMIAWGRGWLSARFYRWINLACGLAMAYFGIKLLAVLTSSAPAFRGP
jgi:chemosensory pili system protein ChpE